MIKITAGDIRIGNWLLYASEGFSGWVAGQVTSISKHKFTMNNKISLRFTSIDRYQPIQLNNIMIREGGFIYNGKIANRFVFDLKDGSSPIILDQDPKTYIFFTSMGNRIIDLYSLHQLQNFFHDASGGKELKVDI